MPRVRVLGSRRCYPHCSTSCAPVISTSCEGLDEPRDALRLDSRVSGGYKGKVTASEERGRT